ncbi:MAG: hypothetical protein AAGI07_18500 [Bacteroidota bacterium]
MELNSKKLERTSKLVNFSIAFVLCIFLILLSSNIIDDIDDWSDRPDFTSFENRAKVDSLRNELKLIDNQVEDIRVKNERINQTINIAKSNYDNEKQSFENWLAARQTIGSPKEDKEVLQRAEKLDSFYKIEQEWRSELASNQLEIETFYTSRTGLEDLLDKEQKNASEKYNAAIRTYDLKVFLKRLLFAFPILALGIFFLVKYRQNKYWPLFLGFILFSVYVFFFGLVPYLPSYGGYIRYTVGIILSVVLGIYAINRIRSFIEKKKAELKESSTERAKRVKTETAEKALNNHFCPSCGKDFILRKWDNPKIKAGNGEDMFKLVSSFCRHCGLELFTDCKKCGNKNYAHLPFCSNCGDEIILSSKVEATK